MRQNWDELKPQVEAGMAALAGDLDVPLPRDVLGRARLAVRIGIDEHWLERQDTQAIGPELRGRLLAAVRRESRRTVRASARLAWWERNTGALSALASAAMIAICVGIIHYAATRSLTAGSDREGLASVIRAGSDVYESDPVTSSLDEDLRDLEQSIVQWPTDSSDRLEDGLQQLDEQIDSLQMDAFGENGTL